MGTAERKLREKEQRRQHILNTAESLFFEQGADLVTMDDLAAATELSKGTLYLYFRNKEALFLAINARAKKQMRLLMEAAIAQTQASGLEQVIALGRAYISFATDYPDYYQMTVRCFDLEATHIDDSNYAEEAHYHGEKSLTLLIQALHTGQQDGSISSELNPAATALTLWGQFNGLMHLLEAKGKHLQDKLNLQTESVIAHCFLICTRMLAS